MRFEKVEIKGFPKKKKYLDGVGHITPHIFDDEVENVENEY